MREWNIFQQHRWLNGTYILKWRYWQLKKWLNQEWKWSSIRTLPKLTRNVLMTPLDQESLSMMQIMLALPNHHRRIYILIHTLAFSIIMPLMIFYLEKLSPADTLTWALTRCIPQTYVQIYLPILWTAKPTGDDRRNPIITDLVKRVWGCCTSDLVRAYWRGSWSTPQRRKIIPYVPPNADQEANHNDDDGSHVWRTTGAVLPDRSW